MTDDTVKTEAGRALLAIGNALAPSREWAERIAAIEAEAAAQAEARVAELEHIVRRTAGMGWCSQTHHEHLAAAAHAALATPTATEVPPAADVADGASEPRNVVVNVDQDAQWRDLPENRPTLRRDAAEREGGHG